IQRRHQKVLEEAPAPAMTSARREAMGGAAVAAARAIGYQGAGTVEFIAEGEQFFFMEMNTRLQVEHPVTEMVTGLDLVEWQLRVAAGERLPRGQDGLAISGHAVEARLYAEDPAQDFRPSTGRLAHLRLPDGLDGVRVDAGVAEGDVVSVHYDPMIAKIVAHGPDRAAAVARLRAALAATEVVGLATNRDFLLRVAEHPAFAAADLDTGFIARHRADLLPEAAVPEPKVLALAAVHVLLAEAAAAAADPSPWAAVDGWRMGDRARRTIPFREGAVAVAYRAAGWWLEVGGTTFEAEARPLADGAMRVRLGDAVLTASVVAAGDDLVVFAEGASHRLRRLDPSMPSAAAEAASGSLRAPMPGRVARVLVAEGDRVGRGQPLMVLEAMKMEHTIAAPADGRVATLRYREGDLVDEGAELLSLEAAEASSC
ncbi:MAG: biotin/lipoyl-containing protein, partial [Alphaproteobacteria bacterium]